MTRPPIWLVVTLSVVAALVASLAAASLGDSPTSANSKKPLIIGPCANGIAVPGSWGNPGLIQDCNILLGLRDTLANGASLNPNPPKDTDGRREDRGRGVRELQGGWPGLHYWGRWEVSGRSSAAAQGPYGRLRELGCAGWRENTQQGTLADRDDASLRGRWVSCRLGVEWLAAGPRRD